MSQIKTQPQLFLTPKSAIAECATYNQHKEQGAYLHPFQSTDVCYKTRNHTG